MRSRETGSHYPHKLETAGSTPASATTVGVLMVFVYVQWSDASFQVSECTVDEFVDYVIVDTAGILASENENTISIALDYYAHDKLYRRIQHIPKKMILKRINLMSC